MNNIGWCDITLNPVVGCTHGCSYCYARKQAHRNAHLQAGAWIKRHGLKKATATLNDMTDSDVVHGVHESTPAWCQDCHDFRPHAHLERLDQLSPCQKPRRIFIDSMWDWNCRANDPAWMKAIIDKMRECHQHTFIILSKEPRGYADYDFPDNAWLGATVESSEFYERVHELLGAINGNLSVVSYEPAHGPPPAKILDVDWIIIGAETGNRKGRVEPERGWVARLLNNFDGPVFLKDSITKLYPDLVSQDFPEART